MNQHSPTLEIERAVPAENAAPELLATLKRDNAEAPALAPARAKKFNFRKLLMAGVAVAVDDDVVVNQNSQRLCDADDRFRHPNIRL